jgi:hypothetical protein
MVKPTFACLAALFLSVAASASVTFTATFDHWSYVVTGDSGRVDISATGGTTPTLSAYVGVGAYPMGGDNPDSDAAAVTVDVYAVYNVTATKTVGDPFTGLTTIFYENGMALDAYASCSNNATAYARILGSISTTLVTEKIADVSNHNTAEEILSPTWGGPNPLSVPMTQTSSTTWAGTITLHVGYLDIEGHASAPWYSYNEGEAAISGSLKLRNVYAGPLN